MTIYIWIATIIALLGTYLNCKKKIACFYLWAVTNLMWLFYDIFTKNYARAILDIVQFILAIYGIIEWRKIEILIVKESDED